MNEKDFDSLNDKCIDLGVCFQPGPGGLPMALINNEQGSAEIALHGAHVMSFFPKGEKPVLWMSRSSWFLPDKPIRGGIPVCWPWFGGHPSNTAIPAHGFARISEWQFADAGRLDSGATWLELKLTEKDIDEQFKDFPFEAVLHITVGNVLEVALQIKNTGEKEICFSAALHSYFNISDINQIAVSGLAGREYLDTLNNTQAVQNGKITVNAEIDRVYLDTEDACVIEDSGYNRTIRIAKSGSRSTVIWNPWIDKSKRMPDFGDEEYHNMICVETTNAQNDARSLEPGAIHVIKAEISTGIL
ncbi:MAG: D-hexose-6-phosphate mutarotase [Victivallaceae bacterium]